MTVVRSTRRATQLAISLVNRPGMLAQICRALASAEINIHALTVIEVWGENSTVRVVVSDTKRAEDALTRAGITAMETDVLMIEAENKPGALAMIAERLAEVDVNVEYAYLSSSETSETSCMIVRPSDIAAAERALAATGEL